ncbi:hypothetical protein BAE44_0003710 [Dichanthelium oligosanthes]|uniref:FBD domain-containing protein n=1 Tax=Dichanthelium oligosanthes TaxID=888268 RepID=A0A1E5WD28_9POAL|nr:hypothetical protein BAE44_0003710 [Dichanthelium oligosanthes]
MPDVFISVRRRASDGDAVRLATSAARLAAGRVAARFHLYLSPSAVNLYDVGEDEEVAAAAATLQLPCFPRATEFALTFMGVDLRMPETAGTFAKLTKLFICGVQFTDDGEGISNVVSQRCPCLESLEPRRIHGVDVLVLHAQSLLYLRLSMVMQLERLLVVSGSLRELQDHEELNDLIENVKLPHHSELELIVNINQHKFGPTSINLLKKSSCVRKLSLQVYCGEIDYIQALQV